MHITKVIVHYINGIMSGWTQGTLMIDSVVETTGFQFGEDFSEKSRLSIDPQHTRAEAVEKQQASDKTLILACL